MSYIVLRLCDGRTESIQLPEGSDARRELENFITRRGRYAQDWLELQSGEFVRYDQVVGLRAG